MSGTQRARAALGMSEQAEPGKELSVLDQRIHDLRGMEDIYARAAVGGVSASVLVRDAETALRNLPELAKTERGSFFGALMTPAQLGLRPNVAQLGHGWLLPFWSGKEQRMEAKFILGYQGMVELGYRSGLVSKITAATVYSKEHFRVLKGTDDKLEHEPILVEDERGEVIAHYAVVKLKTGDTLWHVMGEDAVRRIMQRSQSGSRGQGPWASDYEAMAQKTPLRALWRFMPKTEILALALSTDGVVRQHDEAAPAAVTITREDESEAQSTPESPPDEQNVQPDVQDADVVPEPGEDASGRPIQETNKVRTGLIDSIESKLSGDSLTGAIIVSGDETIYSLDQLRTEELRAVLALDIEAIRAYASVT